MGDGGSCFRSTLNRFLSADTIVPDPTDPQTLNRYSYTLNNPIRYSDPTGHCAVDPYGNRDEPECWEQYYHLVHFVEDVGYSAQEYMGKGEDWIYLPLVFDKQITDNLVSFYISSFEKLSLENTLLATPVNSPEAFIQGYYFFHIYTARPSLAFDHYFIGALERPPTDLPLSYIYATEFNRELTNKTIFAPYGDKEYKLAHDQLMADGRTEDSAMLTFAYNGTTNPMEAPFDLPGKANFADDIAATFSLTVDLVQEFLNSQP